MKCAEMISREDKVIPAEFLRLHIQAVSVVLNHIRLDTEEYADLRIFLLQTPDLLPHLRKPVPVLAVEQMPGSVIGNRNSVQPLLHRRPDIFLHGALPVRPEGSRRIHGMGMNIKDHSVFAEISLQ